MCRVQEIVDVEKLTSLKSPRPKPQDVRIVALSDSMWAIIATAQNNTCF